MKERVVDISVKRDGHTFLVIAHCAGIIPDREIICGSYNDALEVLHKLWDEAHEAQMSVMQLCLAVWDAEKQLLDIQKESMQ